MTDAPSITQGVQFLTHFIIVLILPLIGIAALTTAVIQTVKNMLPLRRWFQRHHVTKWLAARSASALAPPRAAVADQPAPATPQQHLVHLAAAGDARSFYSLPIEQLCGQINASTQVLLDYPALHGNLLRCLASEAHPQDLALIAPTDSAVHTARKALFRKPTAALTESEHNQIDDYVAARNRVSHQIQRAIDGMQVSVSFRWKFWMQLASIIISAALAVATLRVVQYPLSSAHSICFIVLAAIFSGFLAPVGRDLIAALEQVRT